MKKNIVILCLAFGLSGLLSSHSLAFESSYEGTIKMKKPFRAWQGVGSNGKTVYVTSDRSEKFTLSNTISVYDLDGNYIKEIKRAYTGTDSHNRFMSFGDCYVSSGFLYATVYNFNSAPPENERISRIVKYSLPDLKQVDVFDIGDGTAESLAKFKGFFWIVYHDKNEIRKFDAQFRLLKRYPLSGIFGDEGGYQGIFFDGDNLYANLHGSNKFGEKYAQGLDKYHFEGYSFKLIERIKPPTYGSGQGVEKVGNSIFWVDRPGNQIIVQKL